MIIIGVYNRSYLLSLIVSLSYLVAHWILLKYLSGEPYVNICNNSTRQAAIMFVCNHDISKVGAEIRPAA